MKPWCCDRCKAYHQRVVIKSMHYESQQEHDHYEGAMEQSVPQEEPPKESGWRERAKLYRDTLYRKQHMLYLGEKQDYGELCEAMRNACDAIDALNEEIATAIAATEARLSPWLQHNATCYLYTEEGKAEECDCGLFSSKTPNHD
jgi:hypothetical protein